MGKLIRYLRRALDCPRFCVSGIRRSIMGGSALLVGFVPLAWVTRSQVIYRHPGMADFINYASTIVALWYFHEAENQ